MQIHDVEQGSPDWYALRTGIVTASAIKHIMPGPRGGKPKTRASYMNKLIAEQLTGILQDNFTSPYADMGIAGEPVSREAYAKKHGVAVKQLGIMIDDKPGGRVGYSPDGVIGDDGLLEIKWRIGHHQVSTLLSGEVPAEHYDQLQCGLWVSGREWIDYVSDSENLPSFEKRVYTDPEYIARMSEAVEAFYTEMHSKMEKIKENF